MELDVKNPLPLHVQLKNLLKNEILQGEFMDKIPSERELISRFEVSLELSLGIKLWEAEQMISSSLPTADEAKNLDIPETKGVLMTERITCDPDGNPVEYLRGVFREDMYAFRINLDRRRG